MKIIATAGMPGSGKGEFLEYLKTKDIPSIVMREVVEKEMESKGIEVNNKNLREYATELRKEKGTDIVAKMCLPLIRKLPRGTDFLLIDGIRGYDEVKLFKKELTKDFNLVAIFASPKVRYKRLVSRGKKWDMKTWDEFEWRDGVELSWGLGNAIALSDYMIDNSGSLEEMHRKIDEVLSKITG
ncbi:MAG: AAA family ATPase [Candidatus Micrarchaeales archaeon]|jgi:dephospho-CoA kinase